MVGQRHRHLRRNAGRLRALLLALEDLAAVVHRHDRQRHADCAGRFFVAGRHFLVGRAVVTHFLAALHLLPHVDAFDRMHEGHRAVFGHIADVPGLDRPALRLGGLRRALNRGLHRGPMHDFGAQHFAGRELVSQVVLFRGSVLGLIVRLSIGRRRRLGRLLGRFAGAGSLARGLRARWGPVSRRRTPAKPRATRPLERRRPR